MRLYLDAAPIIYAVEQVMPYATVVDKRLSDSNIVTVTSDLTRMECRVKPLRDGNTDLLKDFDDFFTTVAEVVSLSRDVIDHATIIRARYGFKTPDAIHLFKGLSRRAIRPGVNAWPNGPAGKPAEAGWN